MTPDSTFTLIMLAAFLTVLALAILANPSRQSLLRQSDQHWWQSILSKNSIVLTSLFCLLAGLVGWAIFDSALGSLLGAGAGWAVSFWLHRQASAVTLAQQLQLSQEFPLVLTFLALVVESGAPLRWAAEAVSLEVQQLSQQRLQQVLAHCDVGFSEAEAWQSLSTDPVWGELAHELSRCVDSGTAASEILRTAATRTQKKQAAEAVTKARSLGVASTLPLVGCFLPAFILVGVVPIIGGLIGGYLAGS